MKKMFLALIAALTLTLTTAHAADFNKGLEAARAGDYATAFVEFSELAEQGGAAAQYNLGLMYDKGEGVVQDYAEAIKWYILAAAQGFADAQTNLGVMYKKGLGVVQDYTAAVKWYTLAAEQGHAIAQNNLAGRYYKGEGVVQDYALAHMWANIAAANGSETGVIVRDLAADNMAQADILAAQALARECMASNYANCGY